MNLGGLEHLPDCRTLLIRKHTIEVERVMRLWRALVQQMRGQVKTRGFVFEGSRDVSWVLRVPKFAVRVFKFKTFATSK